MFREIVTEEVAKFKAYDCSVEEEWMMYSEGNLVFEDENFKIWDHKDDEAVVLNISKKGVSLRLSYSEWEELRSLVVLGDVNKDFDSERRILFYDQDEVGNALYFRNQNTNILLGCKEYERLKLAISAAGNPHPWQTVTKSEGQSLVVD
jgi:hypothetical protein